MSENTCNCWLCDPSKKYTVAQWPVSVRISYKEKNCTNPKPKEGPPYPRYHSKSRARIVGKGEYVNLGPFTFDPDRGRCICCHSYTYNVVGKGSHGSTIWKCQSCVDVSYWTNL